MKIGFRTFHYVSFHPELFDLEEDPDELGSLHEHPNYLSTLAELEADLRSICNPEEIDERAYLSQCAKVEAAGGRAAVMARGKYQGTPVPGQNAEYLT